MSMESKAMPQNNGFDWMIRGEPPIHKRGTKRGTLGKMRPKTGPTDSDALSIPKGSLSRRHNTTELQSISKTQTMPYKVRTYNPQNLEDPRQQTKEPQKDKKNMFFPYQAQRDKPL